MNKYYQGQMGSGLIDANKLLTLVEGNGVKQELPNIYLATGEKTDRPWNRHVFLTEVRA